MNPTLPETMLWFEKSKTSRPNVNAKSVQLWFIKIIFGFLFLSIFPLTSHALDLKGNISKDSTITLSQSPCNITADVIVLSGATLTFEPGVVVNFMNAGFEIYVGNSATSLGKLNANGATFNGYGPVNVDELIVFRFNSTGTLNNCTFNNVSVVMNESSPTVTNNTFDNCVYPLEFQNECSPVISNMNMLNGVTNRGIKLNGTVNTNWTLQNYGYPYFISAAMTVNAAATFTIADNNVMNTTGAFTLSVGTATTSLGTVNANLVTFNGVTSGTTDQLAFKFGSTGNITNCTFTAYDITCSVSSPEIKNNTFDNAFISLTESSPAIQDNAFNNVAYPVLFIDECSPALSNMIMLSGVTNRGIRLTGTVNKDWTLQNYGYPYFITAAMTINAAATFTIADNNILNTTGAFAISVGTATTSLGSVNANLVTFNGVTSGTTDQLAFKFGSTGKITNCTFTAYDITCSVSSPEIKNNTFDNAFISLTESSPIIQDNTFDNVAYPVLFIDECSPVLTNMNMLSGVTNRGIRLTGTVNKDWTLQNYGYPYFITASITVNTGATFTIADNNIINTTGGYAITVGTSTSLLGNLIVNKVTFQGITTNTADQIAVKFSLASKITNCTFIAYDITCLNASPEIKNNTFNNAFISLNEASPVVQDNTFENVTYPVEFANECSPTLSNLILLSGVVNRGIKLTGTVNTDWTLQNYGYPYFVTASITVNAGAKFTIAQNDTINFTGAYSITAGTATTSLGTIIADNVIFKGYTASTTDQLAFRYGSGGKVTNCSFTAFDVTCANASNLEIKNNSFDNAFISLTESSPIIQDNTFDNVAYPVLFIDECSPVLTNLNMSSTVTNRGIRFTGTVNTDWTLQNYGYPYFVTAIVTVNAGANFTIAENDTINLVGGNAINLGTATNSIGNIICDKVIFKGQTNTTNDQLAFKFGSTGKVTNTSFTAVDLTCSASNPEIRNNNFNNAFISLNESSPIIDNNTFDNTAYPLEFVNECTPTLSNLIMNSVTNRGIKLSGTVNTDWTLQNYGYPYFIGNTLTVNTGATFTIAKGDSIKFVAGYNFTAGTSTTSLGTIIADSVFFQGVTNSTSDQLAFKFGSTGKITNCTFTAVDITSAASTPEIRNNAFDNAIISLNESSGQIHDNTFENVAYPVEFVNECSPALSNLFMNSVTNPGIKLSGTVNTDWTLQNYGYPYYLTAALTINSGAKMTSADYNRILFNGYSINVGSSATSMGSFSARRNSFINLKTSDYYLYYKFSAGGELDSCDIKGLRVHIDASSPKITRSKFHKAQNAVYVINNGNPELSENIFYNNTIALKNAGTNTVIAQNNFWGHKSGPIHPSNPTGKGEKIEGTVDFSGYSEKPLYGKIVPQFSVENLVFDTLLIGKYKDVTLTVKSKGDIDLLIPDILTTDPSFSIQIPASRRGWISDEDSMKVTVRFRPQRPLSYNEIANFLTNETDKPSYPIQLTGVGLPVLTFGADSLVFDSVNYKLPQTKYIKIENISKDYTVLIDSIVNFNFKVLVFENKKPDLSKVKSENDETKNIESGIKNFGFVVYNTTPTYLAVKYYPYQSVSDSDEIRIYYNGGGLHKVKFRANIISDKVSAQILSLDYRQFPNVYLNAQIDTFAVNHNQFTEKDIQVFENGVLQTEGYKVTLPGEGNNTRLTDIVFMMDNSGSMSEEQAQVRNNVYKFLTTLNRKGINFSLGLCRYGASENSGNPIIENNGILTQDSTYFKNTLWAKNNVSGGSEPGYYAIMQSAANFKFRPGSQKVFIIITDETPKQGSLGSFEGAINACLNQKITLFAFTINDLYQLFTPITDLTKGRVFNITSSFDLLLEIISNMVSNNYVIQYTSSDPLLNGITRHVEIKVNYNSDTASDTTSYVPGAIPSIKRTNPTLSLHTKAWEPGTPLNIEVEVLDAIPPFANNVILYYRKSNTPVYYSLQMNSTNGINFMATIPDSVVQAPGVDYYVTATDGMTTCDDPSIDAINNPYKIAVTPNQAPVIEHTPITDGIFGRDIIVQATVTDNTNIVASVEFYYRKKGQLVFNKHTMNHTGNNIYETVISKRYSTEDDIEYYLKATDDFGISTFAAWPYEPYSIKMANAVGFNIIRSENEPEIYPNPIKNGLFTITFINTELAERCKITLLNATGMKLAEIRNEFIPVGKNVIPVQLKDIGRGIYLVEISTGKGVYYRKLVVE